MSRKGRGMSRSEKFDPQIAASGGGVSNVIPTPDWQTGVGVPSARAGRYTPDVSFSSSGHDAYFGCFAAGGGSCVVASNGSFQFEGLYGTSAAAPSMAGIAALLAGRFGAAQGNLNPAIYQMAASNPASFHDATVATSGVSNCSVATPSMCNNSVPSANPVGNAQAGYLITAGYDEVTGLGSLDAANFLSNFMTGPTIDTSLIPQLITFPVQLVGLTTTMGITVGNSGFSALNPLSVSFTGGGAADFSADNGCQVSLAPGARCTFQLTFAPSEAGTITATMTLASTNAIYSSNVSLVGGGTTQLFTPVIGWELPSSTPTIAQVVPITMVVGPPAFAPTTVTGSVVLQAGSFTSPATALNTVNTVEIDIPAGALTAGSNTLTATFTPDSASSAYFTSVTGTTSLVVATPGFKLSGATVSVAPGAMTGNTSTITVTPTGGFTGSVALTATISSSPASAQNLPVLSFGSSSPVTISGSDPGTATLTISTTAPLNSASAKPSTASPWYFAGGGSLACILLIGLPRRRKWQMMVGIAGLLVAFGAGLSACSGGGGGGQSSGGTTNSGTTPGTYILTVNPTSGLVTASNSITLTVE